MTVGFYPSIHPTNILAHNYRFLAKFRIKQIAALVLLGLNRNDRLRNRNPPPHRLHRLGRDCSIASRFNSRQDVTRRSLLPEDRTLWSASRLYRGAALPHRRPSLALLWAGSGLSIERGHIHTEMEKDDLVLVDLRQRFGCRSLSIDWSARLLEFGNRDIERKFDGFTASSSGVLDGQMRPVSAIQHVWLALEDFRASGLETNEYKAMDLLVTTLVAVLISPGTMKQSVYTNALLGRAEAIVRSELSNPTLDVGLIADHLRLSNRRIAAIFAKSGKTPTAFIRAERMAYAESLLADEKRRQRKIGSIATACGYNDANHFSRDFKSQYGMTPSEYRWHERERT